MRINDVSYERTLLDRILGCGTLYVQTAAEGGTIELKDVPDVERVHLEMTELLFGSATPDRRPLTRPDTETDGT
jgi:membrane protein YdbS with pleckstrin-like domain